MPKLCKKCGINEIPPLAKRSGYCDSCAAGLSSFNRQSEEGFSNLKSKSFSRNQKKLKSSQKLGAKSQLSKKGKLKKTQKKKGVSENTLIDIRNFKEYAKRKITKTLAQQGRCTCMECEMHLDEYGVVPEQGNHVVCTDYVEGMRTPFVAHLYSGGAKKHLYLIQENSIYLCDYHHMMLDQNRGGKAQDMLCYDWIQYRKLEILNNLSSLRKLNHNKNYESKSDA